LVTTLGLLAGKWADYDGATDLKRRGIIFRIGSRLAVGVAEIRFYVSSSEDCQNQAVTENRCSW